jgi:casein kinase II subunit beta
MIFDTESSSDGGWI